MSILVNKHTKVITQGMTGKTGEFPYPGGARLRHRRWSPASPPARAGSSHLGLPQFDTVAEARAATGATASVASMCPPPGAADAILEAIDAKIELIVCITEGIPVLDMVRVKRALTGSGFATDRPQLPRRADPRRMQDRHHAGLDLQGGVGRRRQRARAR